MKDLFCVKEQKTTAHEGKVDFNGEFVFTCGDCGSFVKYPADTTPEKLDELIAIEEEQNKGQVNIEGQEDTLKEMLGDSYKDSDDEPED